MMPLVPIEQLIEQYPLKVGYAGGGIHYLLEWYTHNGQWHTIVAKTPRQVETLFLAVFQKFTGIRQDYFRLGRFLKVEVVAPPSDYLPVYAMQKWNSEVNDFWQTILAECFTPDEDGVYAYRPPPGIIACTKDGERDCGECVNGMRPAEGTLESVYLAKRDAYLTEYKSKPYVNPNPRSKKVISRARTPEPGEKVQVLTFSSGHHQEGTRILSSENRELWPWEVCFYFIELESLDRSEMDAVIEMEARDSEAARERSRLAVKARFDRDRKEREDRIGKMFPGPQQELKQP